MALDEVLYFLRVRIAGCVHGECLFVCGRVQVAICGLDDGGGGHGEAEGCEDDAEEEDVGGAAEEGFLDWRGGGRGRGLC